jgi:hypothetical protein
MNYTFDIKHAEEYGVGEAILMQNFLFWILKNKANNKHKHEGKTWTYNSYKALAKLFPFWSKNQVRTRINSLVEQDVLVKGNFNKNPHNQTTWYALTDLKSILENTNLEMRESTIGTNGSNDSTIDTDRNTYINTDDSSSNDNEKPQKSLLGSPIVPKHFDTFWKLYPNRGSKGKALKAWNKICDKKPKKRPHTKQISKAIREQQKSDQWQTKKYIPHASTWLNQKRWLDDPEELKSFDDQDSPQVKRVPGSYYEEDYDFKEDETTF